MTHEDFSSCACVGYVLGAPPVVMMDIAEVTVTHGQKRWMDGWMDGWRGMFFKEVYSEVLTK